MAGDAFIRALEQEMKLAYRDMLVWQVNHSSEVFGLMAPDPNPRLGPPKPDDYALKIARIMQDNGLTDPDLYNDLCQIAEDEQRDPWND